MVPNQESMLKDCIYAVDRNISSRQVAAELSQTIIVVCETKELQQDKDSLTMGDEKDSKTVLGDSAFGSESNDNFTTTMDEDEAKDSASRVTTNDLFSETNILQGGDTAAICEGGGEVCERLRGGSGMFNSQFGFNFKQRMVDNQAAGTPASTPFPGSSPTTPVSRMWGSPCGSSPCGGFPCGSSPCGSSPCGSSPCGSSPCGSSPCGKSPCGSFPCGSYPCGPKR